jgi:hypothetical protein
MKSESDGIRKEATHMNCYTDICQTKVTCLVDRLIYRLFDDVV